MLVGLIVRDVDASLAVVLGGEHTAHSFAHARRHIAHTGCVVLHVLLEFEGFDAVGQLDKLDSASEARPCDICANLGQQIVVGSGLSLEPSVFQSFLHFCVSEASSN